MDWLQSVLERKYKIKTQRIGDNQTGQAGGRLSEGQVLNRVVRWNPMDMNLKQIFGTPS